MSAPGPAPSPDAPAARPAPSSIASPSAPLCHPRTARLLTPAAFQRVFAQGRRVAGRFFQLHVLAEGDAARLGLAVSRKVDRRAVVRNRIRRIAREAFRQARPGLGHGDYVLLARRESASAPRAALHAEAAALLRRATAVPASSLKRAPPAGTMPAAAPPGAPPPDSPS